MNLFLAFAIEQLTRDPSFSNTPDCRRHSFDNGAIRFSLLSAKQSLEHLRYTEILLKTYFHNPSQSFVHNPMEINHRLVKPHLHALQDWNRLDYEEIDPSLRWDAMMIKTILMT